MSEGFDQDLTNAVEELSRDIVGFKQQLRINRNWRRVLLSLMALKVVTIIVLVAVIVNLADTQRREHITRSQVLCPLFSRVVSQADLPKRDSETEDQYAQRVSFGKFMHDSYKELNCQPVLK